jgi:hypothetical protein
MREWFEDLFRGVRFAEARLNAKMLGLLTF